MKWYLAGPMTGHQDLNFPLFKSEAARLRSLGHDVVSPAEINVAPASGWAVCLRRNIARLVECDGIALLPGWFGSRGALLELHIATSLGMSVRMAAEMQAWVAPAPAIASIGEMAVWG